MIHTIMDDLRGKRVLVAGLGRFGGGVGVCKWLASEQASVTVIDSADEGKLADSIHQLESLDIQFRLGRDLPDDFAGIDLIVVSPAIPPHSAFFRAAMASGIAMTSEIGLFVERCPARRIVGVTGTKGKSTTTALLGRMLKARHQTWVGGNIGGSLLGDLPRIGSDDVAVLELSSFMLHHLGLRRFSPYIAVVTMVWSDHLDWHQTRQAYVDAKRNIVRFQRPEDYAVLNAADPTARSFDADTAGQCVWPDPAAEPFSLRLPGAHNQFNAQLAFAAAKLLGIDRAAAQDAIGDFAGLPHRLELVHESRQVRWINDSIATIPEAARAAMEAFAPGTVIQILGGRDKHLPFDSLARSLAQRGKAALCIGETASMLAQLLRQHSADGRLHIGECRTLEQAVADARTIAAADDVVLLSPGCPSYDQFVNFESRGQAFTALAKAEIGAAVRAP